MLTILAVLCLTVNSVVEANLQSITEDNWRQILEGEWMVELEVLMRGRSPLPCILISFSSTATHPGAPPVEDCSQPGKSSEVGARTWRLVWARWTSPPVQGCQAGSWSPLFQPSSSEFLPGD